MRNQRIGVLVGGENGVGEDASGRSVLRALRARGFDARPVPVRALEWALRPGAVDAVFVTVAAGEGADGRIQGMLEVLGIPYTGARVLPAALSADKVRSKQLFRLHNLPTPRDYVLRADAGEDAAEIHGDFGFPVVVKPLRKGLRSGVNIARNAADLQKRVRDARISGDPTMVERRISGTKLTVAVVGDRAIGTFETPEGGSDAVPISSGLSSQRVRGVEALACAAQRALGCAAPSLVDVIVSRGGNEFVLGLDAQPDLHANGVLARIAETDGLNHGDLLEEVLKTAGIHIRARPSPAAEAALAY